MKMSKLLWLSLFVTVVILVVVGGVTASTISNRSVQSAADFAAREAEYQAREAQYQQLLQQANTQIEKANTELQVLQGNPAQNTAQTSQADAAAKPAVSLSAEKAAQIALDAVEPGLSPLKTPELVRFQGKAAFEVAFEGGSVYVDAQTGEVLFNGTVPQVITADQAAKVAADYLHISGILQTDVVPFRGQNLYRVIFKNGTIAYLDQTGQIMFVHPYDPNASQNLQASADNGGGGGGGSNPVHHEDHEDDD